MVNQLKCCCSKFYFVSDEKLKYKDISFHLKTKYFNYICSLGVFPMIHD